MTKTEIQERIEIEQEKRARALEKWNMVICCFKWKLV
jgi:hypothetical protein